MADVRRKKACVACLKNCVRLHGDVEDEELDEELTPAGSSGPAPKENLVSKPGPMENGAAEPYPSFLKKMTELSITSALQIPASFGKSFVTRLGKTITLEGPGNQKWRVEIGPGKEINTLEFGEGWNKFVVDHILQIGDQLSFTLTADSYFQVMVYDESGIQKISATDAVNSPTLQQSILMAVGQDLGGPSFPVRNRPSARPKQKVRRKIRTDGAMPLVKPDVSAPVVHSSESELRNSDTPEKKNNSTEETASEEKSHGEPGPDESRLLPPHVLLEGHVISRRRPVTKQEKDRARLAAETLSASITNPKLVITMSKGYVYRGFWLAPSKPWARTHMPKENREVTMMNMAGTKWTVKWLYKDPQSSGFSGGWRGFALDHRLEEGDVCVFEIVDKKNYVLLVHIFRVIGSSKEETRDYGNTPGRSRNADWIQTSNGYKRSREADVARRHAPGPSNLPLKKSFVTGKYETPDRYSKFEGPGYSQTPPKFHMVDCRKRGPKPATNDHGARSPDFVPDETLQYAKKAKNSPTTSCEVYAEYTSFVTPPPGDVEEVGLGAGLDVSPILTKESAADKNGSSQKDLLKKQSAADKNGSSPKDLLIKLGKELVQATKSTSSSPASSLKTIIGVTPDFEETEALVEQVA